MFSKGPSMPCWGLFSDRPLLDWGGSIARQQQGRTRPVRDPRAALRFTLNSGLDGRPRTPLRALQVIGSNPIVASNLPLNHRPGARLRTIGAPAIPDVQFGYRFPVPKWRNWHTQRT
jgi:hypothetical protein